MRRDAAGGKSENKTSRMESMEIPCGTPVSVQLFDEHHFPHLREMFCGSVDADRIQTIEIDPAGERGSVPGCRSESGRLNPFTERCDDLPEEVVDLQADSARARELVHDRG